MSGYRCVNYYELCRLCTASHGSKKIHIFSEEGKKKNLYEKISECLPIEVSETDKLPKIVCTQCLTQVESIAKFRETCINAQTMLESCLNSSKLRNGGKVYIKDVSPKKMAPSSPPLLKSISNTSTTTTKTTAMPMQIGKTTLIQTSGSQTTKNSDFLSSIIQAVGIQNVDDTGIEQQAPQTITIPQQQPIQQYTITLDGQTLKTNQLHYKIEPTGAISVQEPYTTTVQQPLQIQQTVSSPQQSTLAQVDEFLKINSTTIKATPTTAKRKEHQIKVIDSSPMKKQKINLVLTSPPAPTQQHTPKLQTQSNTLTTVTPMSTTTGAKSQAVSIQDLKFLSGNKCFLPFTLKDGNSTDQQNLVLPTAYLQMKLPQITTMDGQHVVQLTSANSLPTSISLAPDQTQFVHTQASAPQQTQQIQSQTQSTQHTQSQPVSIHQTTIMPETRTLFTTSSGQNVTISHPIQQQSSNTTTTLTALQPVSHHTSTLDTPAGKVHLTTLQNVSTGNITHPLPQKSAITFQRVKVDVDNHATNNALSTGTTTITTTTTPKQANNKPQQQHIFKLPTLTNTSTAQTTSTTAAKTNAKKSAASVVATTSTITTTPTPVATVGVDGSGKVEVPTCEICEKVFKRKEHLAQHMKLHLGLRPFKCEEPNCNKAFSRKEHLMRHCVSHTGKKQFDCEFCHKLFSRKDNLNKHRRSHEQKQNTTTVVYTVAEVK